MEIATLAGGCFWCTEAIFKRLNGVTKVVSGYSGKAESIQITFDSKIVSFEKILEIFWHLVDPTTLNKQGADTGIQYRSAIFYHDENQRKIAGASREKMDKSKMYPNPIVTKIEPFTNFYQAEDYHQNYYERNSHQPYCQIVIDPKIQKLYQEFKENVRKKIN